MPETVAVTSKPVEIPLPKELARRRVLIAVEKTDARVDIVDDIESNHVLTSVYPGGTVSAFAGDKLFAVSKSDSKITISPG